MPVKKCDNGKWRIGEGKCRYDTKEDAEKAFRFLAESGQLDSGDSKNSKSND